MRYGNNENPGLEIGCTQPQKDVPGAQLKHAPEEIEEGGHIVDVLLVFLGLPVCSIVGRYDQRC